MNAIFGLLLAVAVGMFAQMPSTARAQAQSCALGPFVGVSWTNRNQRPFILTTQQKDGSYSVFQTGVLRSDGMNLYSVWTTEKNAGLFSNREDGNQPFDVTDGDERRITISRDGVLFVENLDYGTSERLTNPTCYGYGSAIVWSNSARVYVLTYGRASRYLN